VTVQGSGIIGAMSPARRSVLLLVALFGAMVVFGAWYLLTRGA
jgi:hypothetical protein